MMSLSVRRAESSDVESLVAFNRAMALETEHRALDETTVRRGVKKMFSSAKYGFYLVAEDEEGKIIGGLMITYEWSDWRNGSFWWIQSVYVVPDARGRGVYRRLYEKVHELAKTDGDVCGFRLYVERNNVAARGVYEKLGMTECDYVMYVSED